ncbi:S8/S53 family peptidase [Hydrogenophaga pseudoflava]|uniref:Subtilisin DY n=1 Tax=Hydrogenophaga pseudoflava TaxID=47421 RepID=A0A4P6WXP8_HYDPS|nr:S8/S53 family peptidase [Hydrogenophaga pseudoflava]QBM28822.1 Subtilisin DY [Hydrogenophaga pseudoflava]
MRPYCLEANCISRHGAENALSSHLPDLDVELFPYVGDTVLLPPHLEAALVERLGAKGSRAALTEAGLSNMREEDLDQVLRKLLQVPAELAHRTEQARLGAESADARTWHLDMCRVREAWAVAGGPYDFEWGTLCLGQVDTGYTSHPAFGFPDQPSVRVELARDFMESPPPGDGRDPLTGGSGGHGTASGSLINAYDMITPCLGVAPRVPLVPTRISDCVIIDDRADEFESAVRYLVDEVQVGVINVSMGTFARLLPPAPLVRALDHAYDRGVIVCCAAGNVPVPQWPAYPARLARSIAVAGVTQKARRWALSSSGDWVDFSAPAKQVWRAISRRGCDYDFARTGGGTTFAAAMTSGAAALWLLRHDQTIANRYGEPWQRIEAFRLMACRTAWRPSGWDVDAGLGSGILNVAALMDPQYLPDPRELERR